MTLQVGDRVGYSRAWLQSTASFTGPLPRAKGVVMKLEEVVAGFTLAHIAWDHEGVPMKVNVCNLAKVGTRKWMGI